MNKRVIHEFGRALHYMKYSGSQIGVVTGIRTKTTLHHQNTQLPNLVSFIKHSSFINYLETRGVNISPIGMSSTTSPFTKINTSLQSQELSFFQFQNAEIKNLLHSCYVSASGLFLLNQKALVLQKVQGPQALMHQTEYLCPSYWGYTPSHLLVLQQLLNSLTYYECPHTQSVINTISIPSTSSSLFDIAEPSCLQNSIPKLARRILKIRRKKMKRHLLKKFRKRMVFTLRKQLRERRLKKEALFLAKLQEIKKWGETFSAEKYVKEELEKARRGGFFINIFARK